HRSPVSALAGRLHAGNGWQAAASESASLSRVSQPAGGGFRPRRCCAAPDSDELGVRPSGTRVAPVSAPVEFYLRPDRYPLPHSAVPLGIVQRGCFRADSVVRRYAARTAHAGAGLFDAGRVIPALI